MDECEELLRKIKSQNLPLGDVVVTLEDFFIGNSELGSIGCNLGRKQPPVAEFYDTLLNLRSQDVVQDVLVRISDDQTGAWPFTDTIYVLTSTSEEDLKRWVSALLPSEIHAGWMYGKPSRAPKPAAGMKPYSIWWD